MSDDLIAKLRHGCILHPRRWSGDTHADLGGSIQEAETDALMREAADRIESLEAALQQQGEAVDVPLQDLLTELHLVLAHKEGGEPDGLAYLEQSKRFDSHAGEFLREYNVELVATINALRHFVSRQEAPEHDSEAVAWPKGVLNRKTTLEVLTQHNAWRRGAEGGQTDPRMLGLALDAAIAALGVKS